MKRNLFLFLFFILFIFCLFQMANLSFEEENSPASIVDAIEQEIVPTEKIVFVGDMMFDRGVERLMINSDFTYPIEFIKKFLNSFDYIVGNLEGPINEDPEDFTDSSMQFSFDKRVLDSLENFSVLSLANNHTLNTGNSGLEETRSILKEANIGFTGDPTTCGVENVYQKDGFSFFGINETFYFNCSNKEITDSIEEYKFYNPESFLIILIHWGNEYENVNSSSQQKLARLMIDSGADLIIGGHPHVVQNIELYKNKLIFYSLGNFIFDQYPIEETLKGLVVGLDIYPEYKEFTLYPVENVLLSKPQLMSDKEEFLENLSLNSSEELKDSIKKGVIIIK
ncbi:MAG: CapA family protein [Candidatus Paceibacterota bacterium]